MNTRLKMASLAALTAATLALPAAAQDMKDGAKCAPKASMSKCCEMRGQMLRQGHEERQVRRQEVRG